MVLDSEKLVVNEDILLEYKQGKKYFVSLDSSFADAEFALSNVFRFKSSVMKNLRKSKDLDKRLVAFMDLIDNTMSFELLTPEKMRLSSRGTPDIIEASGKNLPSFIKKMSPAQKESFMKKIKWIMNGRIDDIDAETKGQPGWTQIKIEEKYIERNIFISSKEMSDGVLRLIAFVAISEIQTSKAVYLLDEIENGINMAYVEKLTKLFSDMVANTKSQVILTTHSTFFMDYFDPESILLLYRTETGETCTDKPFDNADLREQLEYMFPGEIILNMNNK